MRAIDQIKTLNQLPRDGYVIKGVKDPETVGEHTVGCVAMAVALADQLNVSRNHLVHLLTVHDWPESNKTVGDRARRFGVAPPGKFEREHAAMKELCEGLEHGQFFFDLWIEYEEGVTPEAQIANQIDKLQMAFQAVQYSVEQGMDPTEFMNHSDGVVRHPVLRDIFERLRDAVALPE